MAAENDLGRIVDEAARLRDAGRNEEARALLVSAQAEHGEDPRLAYHLAWIHDRLGLEAEAVRYYEASLAAEGLSEDDTRGALLGLGSTYRALGRYRQAVAILRRGLEQFPGAGEFRVFLAMALYNDGDAREACRLLLEELADSSSDPGVVRYREAIEFYAPRLDEIW